MRLIRKNLNTILRSFSDSLLRVDTRKLAFLFTSLSLLAFASTASAQGYRVDGTTQARSGFPAAAVTIAVCAEPATVTTTPCSTLTTLYTDSTLTTPCSGTLQPPPATSGGVASSCSNPLVADGLGNYHYYVASGRYALQFYGGGITTYTQRDQIYPCPPSGACIFSSVNGYVFVTTATAAAVNTAIQSLPGNGVGGTIYLPCNVDIVTSGSTVLVDRPLTLVGCNARVGPFGTRLVSNDSNIPLSLTNNAAFGVTLRNFGICGNASTTAAVGADLDNNVADVTFDHVYIGTCGGSFSTAAVRVGSRTTGSPVLNVAFHNTVVTGAPVGYLILRANDVRTYSAKAYDNTTAQMQIGDSTHQAINVQNYDPDFEPNAQTAATDVIVLNASSVGLHGGYHEVGAAGVYFLDIPNTATAADNIVVDSSTTIRGDAVANRAIHINLASAVVRIRDTNFNNFAASPTYIYNDASRQIFVESITTDTGSSTLIGGAAGTTGVSYVEINQGSSNSGSLLSNPLIVLSLTRLQSGTTNPAASGLARFSSSDQYCWRNPGNTGDNCLSEDTSGALNYAGTPLAGVFTKVNVTPVTVNTSTTADQNLMAVTITAGALSSASRTLLVQLAGVYSTPAGSTAVLTHKLKLCTVSGCGSGTVLTLATWTTAALGAIQVTNDPYNAVLNASTQTAGASAAFEAHGNLTIDLSALTTAAEAVYADNNTATIGTIDSTAQLFLQHSIAFSAASASNSATDRQMIADTVD